MPRVMQRSYIVKSSGELNGPSPKVPRSRGARRFSAAGVNAAVRPIDDDRGLPEGTPGVVAAECADGVQRVLDALLGLLLAGSPLLVGLIQVGAEICRPRHRDAAGVVARPHALEIRVAPWRL